MYLWQIKTLFQVGSLNGTLSTYDLLVTFTASMMTSNNNIPSTLLSHSLSDYKKILLVLYFNNQIHSSYSVPIELFIDNGHAMAREVGSTQINLDCTINYVDDTHLSAYYGVTGSFTTAVRVYGTNV